MCFFFQAEDGIRDDLVTGVQTCALPIFIAAIRSANYKLVQYQRVGISVTALTTCDGTLVLYHSFACSLYHDVHQIVRKDTRFPENTRDSPFIVSVVFTPQLLKVFQTTQTPAPHLVNTSRTRVLESAECRDRSL